jgi:hypothetical protein
MLEGCGEKGTLIHCWWKYKLVVVTTESIMEIPKMVTIELSYDPAIPLGIHPKKMKSAC